MILPEEWPRCRPWIEAALEHCGGTHAIEDIEAGVARALAGEPGGLYFLPGERCAMVLEHVRMPRKAVLNIFLAGAIWTSCWGSLTDW